MAGPVLHDELIAWGADHPDAIAVRTGSESMSCGELLDRSATIAGALAGRGIGAGSIVGVCLPRTPELISTLVGVLRSGAAYLPLDPNEPAARRAAAVEEMAAALVIGGGGTAVDDLESGPSATPVLPDDQDALAYVITTSGTTGRPKGVMIPHRCIIALFAAMDDHIEAAEGDVWLSLTSAAFDISVFEFFWTLSRGMTLHLADTSAAALFSTPLASDDHDITHTQATPTLLAGLLMDPATRAGIGRLRHLTSTGEALPAALAHDLRDLMSGTLLNAYGPTEATIWASVDALDAPIDEPLTIGRPLAGQSIVVLDEAGAPVADGDVGELYIGGSGVALGYFGQPQLTADRFVEVGAERRYRTGDLGHVLPDGRIVCLGRTDRQVKVRGHRIELDEVEHALLAIDGVDAAAALVLGEDSRRRIVAVVVGSADAAAVRSAVGEALPAAAVPAEVRVADDLPTTTSGKVDRTAIAERW